ncbi:MAG: NAD-dependent epimerase/dehydratase family protein [Candidatus Harrisonbacteria bacterium]|nr:NAD-dependent epimerase/dehydratase family protein [Candidatus Harrisonbacteria bacterium]
MTNQEIFKRDIDSIITSIEKEAVNFSGKTILMSGGAGFLGNYIISALLRLNDSLLKTNPCKVIAMDNFITGSSLSENLTKNPNFQFIEHDVRKPLPEDLNADFLIHAAGLASPYYYRKFPLETIEVAVNGTKNFLEFAKNKKVQSLLYFSSSEIYGDPEPRFIPTPETYWGNVSAIGPRACYDESKRLGETLCMTYYQLYKVPVKIVRPFNVYGPGMKANDYRVIPTFMVKAIKEEPLPVHDRGNQTRTFCYITDATQGFLKVLASNKNGEVYNVGKNEEEINMMSLAAIISNLANNKAQAQLIAYPESYPAGEPQRRCPDLTKIKKELSYNPSIDLKTGLARTLAWYKNLINQQNES